jgi:hypothetical protein
MARFINCLFIMLLGVSIVSAQESTGLQLKSAASLNELDEGMIERYAALAPDGSALAWGSGRSDVCFYSFAEGETTCYEMEMFRSFARYSFLSWSPDSQTLAFNESLFDNFYESDIWMFDITTQMYGDRTDDGFLEFPLGEENAGALLDYAPTWNPANGDLYFFRSQKIEDTYSLELYLLPLSRTEPKLMRDLTADFPVLSVFRPAAISPNGERMAMVVLAQNPLEDDRSGIWVLTLSDGSLEQVAGIDDLQGGMPEWIGEYLLLPDSVAWAGDGALIVTSTDLQFVPPISQNAYYLDLAADTVQPLVDFTTVASAGDVFVEDETGIFPALRIPKGGAVTPDGTKWVYVGAARQVTEGGIVWSVNLPPDGSEPTLVGTIDRYEVGPWTETRNSFASDGSKALIWGYVLEFG